MNPVEPGQPFDKIPLHMTILPWFSLDSSKQEALFNVVGLICRQSDPFEIIGGPAAMFGPKHDIKVRRVVSGEAEILHSNVLTASSEIGAKVMSSFIGDKFAAHVTDKDPEALLEGKKVIIDSMQLFSRVNSSSQRVVKAVFNLGEQHG